MKRSPLPLALALAAAFIGHAVLADDGGTVLPNRPATAQESRPTVQSPIERALEKQVSIKLKNTPLKEAAGYLADISGVNVLLDFKALANAGVPENRTITFSLADVRFGAALRMMLREQELDYTILDDEAISITTRDEAKQHVTERAYYVKDLVTPADAANEFSAAYKDFDSESLKDLITTCIHPESWGTSGDGVSYVSGCLVVENNLEVQNEVRALLAALQQINAAEKKGPHPAQILIGTTTADEKIHEELKRRRDFKFDKIKLADFAEEIRKLGLPVYLDQKAIADAGGSLDMPLSLAASQVTLKFALHKMLADKELNYFVQDGILQITSAAGAKEHTRVGIYPVGDLVSEGPSDRLDFDTLTDTITSAVGPTSWPDGSGSGPISPLRNPTVIVFPQTDDVHEQISDLFAKLRAAKASAKEPSQSAKATGKPSMVLRVHRMMGGEDKALDQYITSIRSLIEPGSWDHGDAYIAKLPGAIIVRHAPAVQKRIDNLIAEVQGVGAQAGGGFGGGGGTGGGFGGGAFQIPAEKPKLPTEKSRRGENKPTQEAELEDGKAKESPTNAETKIKDAGAESVGSNETPVQRALRKPVKFDYVKTPLKQVAADVAKDYGINVVFDEKALADAGAGPDTQITRQLVGVPLDASLRLTLAEHELAYLDIDDNVLLITSAAKAKELLVTKSYDVHDLAAPAGATGGGDVANGPKTSLNGLVAVITGIVSPASWSQPDHGGSIAVFKNRLIITQTRENQKEIVELLAALRLARDDPRVYRSGGSARPLSDASVKELFLSLPKTSKDGRPLRPRIAGYSDLFRLFETRQDLSFVETPLKDVTEALTTRLGAAFQLDAKAITDAGGSIDMPITFTGKQVRLGTALKLMLEPHDLDYVIDHEVILITSAKAANEFVATRLYSVDDLVSDSASGNQANSASYQNLINVIISTVHPSSWQGPAGTGAVRPFPPAKVLVCSQTEEVHEQIAKLLATLRAQPAAKPADENNRREPTTKHQNANDGAAESRSRQSGVAHGAFQVAAEKANPPTPDAAGAADAKTKASPSADTSSGEQSAVDRALAKPIKFDFVETPLKEVAASLSKQTGLNVLLDEKAITDAGGTVDMPITRVLSGISLKSSLRLMLLEHELNFIDLDNNTLMVTSAAAAKESVVTRTYDVHDLLRPAAKNDSSAPIDDIIEVMTAIVAPTSWSDAGGGGSIAPFDTQLVISQTHEIHEQIVELLATIRQCRDEPRKYRDGGLGADSGPEAKIYEWLQTKQDLDYHETPLKDLVEHLKVHGPEIQLDAKAITDAGGSTDMPITFSAKNMRLESGLRLMLGQHELSYIIDHEVLLITSAAAAKEHVITRPYSVGDLVVEPSRESPTDGDSYEKLVNMITSTIAPTSWAQSGGTGSILAFPVAKTLVCAQTEQIHEEIVDLLAKLRAHKPVKLASAAGSDKPTGEPVTRFYRLSADRESAAEYITVIKKLIEPELWKRDGAYIGKVPDGIVARCSPKTHERIRELLTELDALPPKGAAESGTGIRKKGAAAGQPGSGAF